MIYTSPDLLESYPRDLGFMTQSEMSISGFQHYKKTLSCFYDEITGCVDLLTFVSSSRFYKKIAFVPLSLYQNCQVSKKIEYSQSEEHID